MSILRRKMPSHFIPIPDNVNKNEAVQVGVIEKQPWYEPSDTLPAEPIINVSMPEEFDTVVAERT